MKKFSIPLAMILSILAPTIGWSADGNTLNLTNHWLGITTLVIFALAYLLVMAEEFAHLRKPRPVILAAGLIWALIALIGQARGIYTFFAHLKWTPVIALGYAASIVVHLWINKSLF